MRDGKWVYICCGFLRVGSPGAEKIVVEWLLKHDDVSELWALDQIDREATFINLVAVMNELCALTGLKGFHQAANFMNRPPPSRARKSSLCSKRLVLD